MARATNLALTMIMAALLIAFAYFAYQGHQAVALAGGTTVVTSIGILPYYAFRSFLRMLGAYILSFIFTLTYGYKAGTDPRAERWLIPILDILQSVPILGFFPAAVYFFVSLFQGSLLGVELASIFLIFTSQAWNMTFGFYESLTTIPRDLKEAADAYRLTGWRRFQKLYFPAGIPKLVYNSILSWSGGWYFLIAAEIIAIGPARYSLPGLGSYLIRTTEEGDLGLTIAGLLTLITLITLMNIFIWRPLSIWAENFKYEFDSGGARLTRGWGYRLWHEAPFFREFRRALISLGAGLSIIIENMYQKIYTWNGKGLNYQRYLTLIWHFITWLMILLLGVALFRGLVALGTLFMMPWQPEVFSIPKAIFFSFLRLLAAYILSLAWTVPAAIWIGHNERVYEIMTPVFEVLASVPATALFPIIVFILVGITGGMNLAAIILVLTGMQWYLLFNLIAGVKSIPKDLKEAAAAFGLQGTRYLRRVVLPALVPSLITGSITSWGGGWNALIVAEYVVYAGQIYTAFGIGSLLDTAIYGSGSFQIIWSSLIAMVATIVFLNRFFWRRLYEIAVARFTIGD
ncbi:binding-protein-dependent transport system inner membrane protein [Moorella sp. E308F]|uniref:ABC transporter permease n=1 Tax=unclassified Neomoorella TaxID=2676739 RepID=UPI0010FFC109|nr:MULTISPECIES: ABC transporter permease subunit [unclassified Moorella (in: firmicutes)]GEA14936.1 binding-protein-dependent transport system inner membrane protein [Moorella sp. E308F]GEA17637.1 binding-protein-dependent transport system inner membrane protein [Moorella sp. E306M]